MSDVFRNRADAGKQHATSLDRYAGRTDVVVLALPRGGVPVHAAISAPEPIEPTPGWHRREGSAETPLV